MGASGAGGATGGSGATDDATLARQKSNLETLATKSGGYIIDEGHGKYSVYDKDNKCLKSEGSYSECKAAIESYNQSKNLPTIAKDEEIEIMESSDKAKGLDNGDLEINGKKYKKSYDSSTNQVIYTNENDANDKYLLGTDKKLRRIGGGQNQPSSPAPDTSQAIKDISSVNFGSSEVTLESDKYTNVTITGDDPKKLKLAEGKEYEIKGDPTSGQYIETEQDGEKTKYCLIKNGDSYQLKED